MSEFDWTKVTSEELRLGGAAVQRLFVDQAFPVSKSIAKYTVRYLNDADCEEVASTALNTTLIDVNAQKVKTPGAFLCKITPRKAIDHWRSLRARGAGVSDSIHEEEFRELPDKDADFVKKYEEVDHCWKALSRLSPEERKLILTFAGGASYQELAAEFQLAMGTVASRISSIRKKLKNFLGD